jgi:hypothetical protein
MLQEMAILLLNVLKDLPSKVIEPDWLEEVEEKDGKDGKSWRSGATRGSIFADYRCLITLPTITSGAATPVLAAFFAIQSFAFSVLSSSPA